MVEFENGDSRIAMRWPGGEWLSDGLPGGLASHADAFVTCLREGASAGWLWLTPLGELAYGRAVVGWFPRFTRKGSTESLVAALQEYGPPRVEPPPGLGWCVDGKRGRARVFVAIDPNEGVRHEFPADGFPSAKEAEEQRDALCQTLLTQPCPLIGSAFQGSLWVHVLAEVPTEWRTYETDRGDIFVGRYQVRGLADVRLYFQFLRFLSACGGTFETRWVFKPSLLKPRIAPVTRFDREPLV